MIKILIALMFMSNVAYGEYDHAWAQSNTFECKWSTTTTEQPTTSSTSIELTTTTAEEVTTTTVEETTTSSIEEITTTILEPTTTTTHKHTTTTSSQRPTTTSSLCSTTTVRPPPTTTTTLCPTTSSTTTTIADIVGCIENETWRYKWFGCESIGVTYRFRDGEIYYMDGDTELDACTVLDIFPWLSLGSTMDIDRIPFPVCDSSYMCWEDIGLSSAHIFQNFFYWKDIWIGSWITSYFMGEVGVAFQFAYVGTLPVYNVYMLEKEKL